MLAGDDEKAHALKRLAFALACRENLHKCTRGAMQAVAIKIATFYKEDSRDTRDLDISWQEFCIALRNAKKGKAPGPSGVQIDSYKQSHVLKTCLYDVLRDVWLSEHFDSEFTKGVFVMLYKNEV